MEITIKVDSKKAKQFIGFLETLDYIKLEKPTKQKSAFQAIERKRNGNNRRH